MIGSQEWMEMVDQEIKELQRLLDRKAEDSQIAKYRISYSTHKKKKLVSFRRNSSTLSAKNLQQAAVIVSSGDDDSSSDLSPRSSTPSVAVISPKFGYRFGQDLLQDFSTLFGAFNRVAKQKLDNSILSDFAGVAFVDSLYEKRSIQFSAQLTESYHLYYQLFNEKINSLSQKMAEFHETVFERLDEIDAMTHTLRNRMNRLTVSKQQIAKQKGKSELKETHKIRTLQSMINMSSDFATIQSLSSSKPKFQSLSKTSLI